MTKDPPENTLFLFSHLGLIFIEQKHHFDTLSAKTKAVYKKGAYQPFTNIKQTVFSLVNIKNEIPRSSTFLCCGNLLI